MPSRDHLVPLLGRTLALQKIVVNRTGLLLIDRYLWGFSEARSFGERFTSECEEAGPSSTRVPDCAIPTVFLKLALAESQPYGKLYLLHEVLANFTFALNYFPTGLENFFPSI